MSQSTAAATLIRLHRLHLASRAAALPAVPMPLVSVHAGTGFAAEANLSPQSPSVGSTTDETLPQTIRQERARGSRTPSARSRARTSTDASPAAPLQPSAPSSAAWPRRAEQEPARTAG